MVFKKTPKILKILGIIIGAIYLISGLLMLRHYRTEQEPKPVFRGWIYYWDGPYKGKVVDLDIGEPIEGAVVAGSWDLLVMSHIPAFCDAREAVTNKNGEFVLPRAWCISFWPIAELSMPGNVVVFKPGYLAYPPLGANNEERRSYMPDWGKPPLFEEKRQYNLVRLGRPKTQQEREFTLWDGENILSSFDGYKRLPILLELTNKERKKLGFEEILVRRGGKK